MHRPLAALCTCLLLACSQGPEFTYTKAPGPSVASFRTIALDPRKQVWLTEGQRQVPSEALKAQVQESLSELGYTATPADAADLWVNVVALRPDKGEPSRGAVEGGGRGGVGGGRGGGRSGGGRHGASGGGREHGLERGGGAAAPHSLPREGFNLWGELTIMVQLLRREDAQAVWTGTVFLPSAKGEDLPEWRASLPGLVHRLLEPLPRTRVTDPPPGGVR